MIFNICKDLSKYGVVVQVSCFVEDKYQVKFVISNFNEKIIDKMRNVTHVFDVLHVCDTYDGLLPICYCAHISKRIMSAITNHDYVLDFSNTAVDIA